MSPNILTNAFEKGKKAGNPAWIRWTYYENNVVLMLAIGIAVIAVGWQPANAWFFVLEFFASGILFSSFVAAFLEKAALAARLLMLYLVLFTSAFYFVENGASLSALAYTGGWQLTLIGLMAFITRRAVRGAAGSKGPG